MDNKIRNKNALKVTILLLVAAQMGSSAMSVVISDIAAAFPDAGSQNIQFVMTVSGIFAMVTGLAAAPLAKKTGSKKLIIAGLLLSMLGGLCGFLIHGSLAVLYLWSALHGIGMGFACVLATSSVSEFFTGNERAAMLGLLASAGSLGSMIMNFVGGMITSAAWQNIYLVYLISLPGLIMCFINFPSSGGMVSKDGASKEEKGSLMDAVDRRTILYSAVSCVFFILYVVGPSNFSLMLTERGLGGNFIAGLLSSLLLLGGVLMGSFFGRLNGKLGALTIPLGFALLGAGFLIASVGGTVVLGCIGALIAGASLTVVAPQVNNLVVFGKDAGAIVMAAALATSAGQLGNFLNPVVTVVVNGLTGQDLGGLRLMYSGVFSIILAAVLFVVCLNENKLIRRAR